MSKIDSVCEGIIQEFTENTDYVFEKKAEVAKPVKSVKLPITVNFKKIASEIRAVAKPVEVTYEDLNSFIKEISRG